MRYIPKNSIDEIGQCDLCAQNYYNPVVYLAIKNGDLRLGEPSANSYIEYTNRDYYTIVDVMIFRLKGWHETDDDRRELQRALDGLKGFFNENNAPPSLYDDFLDARGIYQDCGILIAKGKELEINNPRMNIRGMIAAEWQIYHDCRDRNFPGTFQPIEYYGGNWRRPRDYLEKMCELAKARKPELPLLRKGMLETEKRVWRDYIQKSCGSDTEAAAGFLHAQNNSKSLTDEERMEILQLSDPKHYRDRYKPPAWKKRKK